VEKNDFIEERKIMSKKQYKPGEKAPYSDQYGIVGPRVETQERKELL